MTTDIKSAVASVLRKALTDDEMLEVARTILSEMGELDLLTPLHMEAQNLLAQSAMLERAFESGEVVWSGDMLVEAQAETFWLPTPQVGQRVEVTVHLTAGTHTIVGELIAVYPQGVIVRDEKTGNRHYLPGLAPNHLRVIKQDWPL